MQDHNDEPQLHEARTLIDNIRHGAAVDASRARLLEMFAELIAARDRPAVQEPADTYQKPLG